MKVVDSNCWPFFFKTPAMFIGEKKGDDNSNIFTLTPIVQALLLGATI